MKLHGNKPGQGRKRSAFPALTDFAERKSPTIIVKDRKKVDMYKRMKAEGRPVNRWKPKK